MHTLMIVDDEFHIRDGLVNAVPWASIGVEVVAEAQDGREGLELARVKKPELVITDISMDEMDGLTFAEALLAERPKTKVLILSGYGEFEYARRALELKVSAYLLKPLAPDDILAKVAEAVAALEAERARDRLLGLPSEDPGEGGDQRAAIRRVRDYLEEHYADHDTSLDLLADRLGLTAAYVSKLFKAETGRNYSDELAALRIEKAKHLLKTTNLKASEVGQRVGYPNPQYFATAFRKLVGTSPTDYREGRG